MNQRQIESFLAVAETGNFTRAAERLYISQPAVSKQVLSLEEELGFLLLIREYHKDVQLTEAGKLYYDFFHKVMGEYKAVYEQAQQYRKKVRGTVRLGILTGWKIQDKLQNILEQMKQNYPEIEVRMSFACFRSSCVPPGRAASSTSSLLSELVPTLAPFFFFWLYYNECHQTNQLCPSYSTNPL